MDKKTIKSLIYKAASLLLLAIFLCTSVFIYLQKSFGWFSDNDEVSASGISVQSGTGANVDVKLAVDANANGTIEDNEYLGDDKYPIFEELIPKDTVVLYIIFTNNEDSDIAATLSMLAPTALHDVPILHDQFFQVTTNPDDAARYHYFGSQLRMNSITVDGTKTELNKYLLETEKLLDENGNPTAYQTTYVESEYNFESLSDTDIITSAAPAVIEAGETLTVAIEFEFVDNNEIQNAYINFGVQIPDSDYKPICQRTLYCTFEETN